MRTEQIALQFFTLRDHTKTEHDFAEACRKVADIGYPAVQLSAIDYEAVPEETVVRICRDNGLTICATHEPPDMVLNEPEAVVERLNKLGTRFTAYPFPKEVDFGDPRAVADWIAALDRAGAVLAEAGQVLTYHNHHREFRRLEGRLLLDRIYEETSPRHLQGEIDTYWVQYGGGDPVDWCRKLEGREPLLHLKDYRINADYQIEFAEVGAGNLDIPAIIAAAEAGGCEWFIVEQDQCPGDPFESVAESFRYLRGLAED